MRAATLLVMCAAGPIASAQERVAFPANTTPGVIDCGSWSWSMTDRGQCTTALSRPDGGGLYVGSESIAISGDVISCAAAGASNRGCVTTGTQTLAGAKTWSGAQTYSAAIDLQANSTVRGDLLPPGHGFGLGFAVRTAAGLSPVPGSVGLYYWGGIAGTTFFVDPKEDLFAMLMIQAPNQRDYYRPLFRSLVYAALSDGPRLPGL
mgnify:CR=1 FL=1